MRRACRCCCGCARACAKWTLVIVLSVLTTGAVVPRVFEATQAGLRPFGLWGTESCGFARHGVLRWEPALSAAARLDAAAAARGALRCPASDLRLTDGVGENALHAAAKAGGAGAVAFVRAVRSLDRADFAAALRARRWLGGDTPLHIAAAAGDDAVVDALLHGAEVTSRGDGDAGVVDLRNFFGATPLHLAAAAGSEATVRALLLGRASVEARTFGYRPVDLAQTLGHRGVHVLLQALHGQRAKYGGAEGDSPARDEL